MTASKCIKYARSVWILIFISAVTVVYGCRTDDRQVELGLKFKNGRKLYYDNQIKKSRQIHNKKNLVNATDDVIKYRAVEEVLQMIDPESARLRLTYYINRKVKSPVDSNAWIALVDSSALDFIEDTRGMVDDLQPQDTTAKAEADYYEKLYRQLSPRYPDRPVPKGHTWSNSVKLMLADGEITRASTTYRVASFVRESGYDCAVIEYEGNTIVPYRDNSADGTTVIRLDKRFAKGVFYLAYREGFIVRLEEIFDYAGEGTRYKGTEKTDFTVRENGTYAYYLTKVEGL